MHIVSLEAHTTLNTYNLWKLALRGHWRLAYMPNCPPQLAMQSCVYVRCGTSNQIKIIIKKGSICQENLYILKTDI